MFNSFAAALFLRDVEFNLVLIYIYIYILVPTKSFFIILNRSIEIYIELTQSEKTGT